MADPFFYFGQGDDEDYLTSLGLILPPPSSAASLPGTAFEAYQQQRAPALSLETPMVGSSSDSGAGSAGNVHRRMFGYLGRIVRHDAAAAGTAAHHPPAAPGRNEEAAAVPPSSPPQAPRSSRFRHIMRERVRRERLSQGFADLHALLPRGAASSKVRHTQPVNSPAQTNDPSTHTDGMADPAVRRVARTTSSARRWATSGSSRGGRSGSARGTSS
jgi:hypothetical protein